MFKKIIANIKQDISDTYNFLMFFVSMYVSIQFHLCVYDFFRKLQASFTNTLDLNPDGTLRNGSILQFTSNVFLAKSNGC
jgi:hypothetical protein